LACPEPGCFPPLTHLRACSSVIVSKRHVAEFDFRYNNRIALGVDDFNRTMTALLGIKGKRLMYSQAPNN